MSGFKLLPQKVFDAMVIEIRDSSPGMTLLESVQEAKGTFEEDFSLEGLWIYENEDEFKEKEKLEKNLACAEKTAAGTETRVNCSFAFQGIMQALVSAKAWRLIEARRLPHSLIQLLQKGQDEDSDAEVEKSDGEDDGEDEENDRIVFFSSVLDVLLHLASGGSSRFLSAEGAFTLSDEQMQVITSRLDQSMSEKRCVSRIITLLRVILSQPANKAAFAETGVPVLTLTRKFHAKDAELCSSIDHLVSFLSH
jgi:hypothetical protein